LPSVISLQALREAQVGLKSSTFEVALWENDPEAQAQFADIVRDKQVWWAKAEVAWQAYVAISQSAEEAALWNGFVKEWAAWRQIDHKLISLIGELAANRDAGRQKQLFESYFLLGSQQRPHYLAAEKLLGEVIQINARNVAAETERAVASTRLARQLMFYGGGAAVIVLTLLAVTITRNILGQIGGEPGVVAEVVRKIAGGDLRVAVPLQSGDANSLLASVNFMQQQLRELIGHLRGSSDQLQDSARKLATDVTRLTVSGENEAKAASATAHAVEEMTAGIKLIGDSAETASRLSSQAGELAQQGEGVIAGAYQEMESIAGSVNASADLIRKLGEYSEEISAVVNVIRDVADQTNLLALNAAIEAARAGEQGRGFAVVADEVRKLAERTAKSTQEIANVINNIQTAVSEAVASMERGRGRVEEGVGMVRDASQTIERIHAGATEAKLAVGDITDALRHGNRNLTEIAERMDHIVQMVNSNAASVTAMARSTGEVEQLATALANEAAQFRL
jgi:methyl-accepting chemotaxis protein